MLSEKSGAAVRVTAAVAFIFLTGASGGGNTPVPGLGLITGLRLLHLLLLLPPLLLLLFVFAFVFSKEGSVNSIGVESDNGVQVMVDVESYEF